MSDSRDADLWLAYAQSNHQVAILSLESSLFNPCLENAQQAVEKALKTIVVHRRLPLKRTHSIRELVAMLNQAGFHVPVNEDECDLLDSIYLPARYPLDSALPLSMPDATVCRNCLDIAERAIGFARQIIEAV